MEPPFRQEVVREGPLHGAGRNMNDRHSRPPSRRRNIIPWIIGGGLVVLLVFLALQGTVRGLGEAVGITEAAPGDDDADPAPESTDGPAR